MTSTAFNDFVKLPDDLWTIFGLSWHSRHPRPSKVLVVLNLRDPWTCYNTFHAVLTAVSFDWRNFSHNFQWFSKWFLISQIPETSCMPQVDQFTVPGLSFKGPTFWTRTMSSPLPDRYRSDLRSVNPLICKGFWMRFLILAQSGRQWRNSPSFLLATGGHFIGPIYLSQSHALSRCHLFVGNRRRLDTLTFAIERALGRSM